MKIGVISDTHLPGSSPLLEEIATGIFKDTDLILHAGDLTTMGVLDAFRGKEVIAVAGNRDLSEVKKRLPTKQVIPAGRFKIGLIHGWGLPMGIGKRLVSSFQGIHCLVYGHSHWAVNQRRDGILYFNPGAFSGGLTCLWRKSVGLLTLDKDIRGEIVRF
jgi:putative phosphoesterase